MSFELIIGIVCFAIELVFVIISLRNYVFNEVPAIAKILALFASFVPTWGFVLNVLTIAYFIAEARTAGPDNRLFRRSWINMKLFGEDKCEK